MLNRLAGIVLALTLWAGASPASSQSASVAEPYSLLTTPSLLRFPGSPFDALRQYGVNISGNVTTGAVRQTKKVSEVAPTQHWSGRVELAPLVESSGA
jgi:hypothetical protein